MAWDYAELSKMAKANGGPEKLIETVANDGVKTGRTQMLPAVGIALVVGVAGKTVYDKLKSYFADKKTKEEMEAAKKELVKGIKEYDDEHPDDTEPIPES